MLLNASRLAFSAVMTVPMPVVKQHGIVSSQTTLFVAMSNASAVLPPPSPSCLQGLTLLQLLSLLFIK
jgi:hypothetical protein